MFIQKKKNTVCVSFLSGIYFIECDENISKVTSVRVCMHAHGNVKVPYFLGYKTDFFSFQNNPKDLDPSYKTDLDL